MLPANIRIRKTYRGRPTQGRQVRVRRRPKPVHKIRGKGLKSFPRKAYSFAKKATESPFVGELRKLPAKELRKVYSKAVRLKIKDRL